MTLPELIDNLIELSCQDMPDEARQCLDNAIDHIVSSMNDDELSGLLEKGLGSIFDTGKSFFDGEIEKEDYETFLMKSILNHNLAFA